MYWLLWVLLFLFLLFLLIILTKVTVTIDLKHIGDNDHLKIKFRAWLGLIRFTIKVPFVKFDERGNLIIKGEQQLGEEKPTKKSKKKQEKITPEEELKALNDIKEIMQHIVDFHRIVRRFLKKVKIKKFIWHSQIGIGDAAYTGMLAGAAWAVKGGVITILSQYMQLLSKPVITITPEFNLLCSRTKLQCIIQFRIGQAMLAGLQFIKFWKGGRPKLKSKPFSFFSN